MGLGICLLLDWCFRRTFVCGTLTTVVVCVCYVCFVDLLCLVLNYLVEL